VPDTDPSGAEIEVVALAEIPVIAGLNPISLPGPEPRLAELAVALSVLLTYNVGAATEDA
jgi:hypothetical protein